MNTPDTTCSSWAKILSCRKQSIFWATFCPSVLKISRKYRPQGGDIGYTYEHFHDAASVDDGDAVVLVGTTSAYLVAVKLDSNGNELWVWAVGCSHACFAAT